MRIAFFIGSMGRGGAERVISILANEYADKGWDVDVVMLLKDEVGYELRPQIRTIPLNGNRNSYIKNAIHWLKGIRSYVKEEKPDRIVSFVGRINALVLTATLGMKVPIIVSERNDPKRDGRGKFMLEYCNLIYHRANRIVFQNKHEQSCFAKSLMKKSVIIPNPVQVSAIKTSEPSIPIIATAGRLNSQKNHFMLIDAMELVHEKCPEAICKIYGDGDLRVQLQKHIDAKGLSDVVTLEGNRADIHERLAECSIFVLTSEFEGLSNALIEAMMIGLPCITTDYDGVTELIADGDNGLIVSRGQKDELATAILMCIESKSKRDGFSLNAKKSAQSFVIPVVMQQWEKALSCM